VGIGYRFGNPNLCGKKIFAYFLIGNIQYLANGIDLSRLKLSLVIEF
jgi:hypothetical protein